MLETDHVPAPAEHAPRKRSTQADGKGLVVWEPENPATWIEAGDPVGVRR